jgi:hypothetical protein
MIDKMIKEKEGESDSARLRREEEEKRKLEEEWRWKEEEERRRREEEWKRKEEEERRRWEEEERRRREEEEWWRLEEEKWRWEEEERWRWEEEERWRWEEADRLKRWVDVVIQTSEQDKEEIPKISPPRKIRRKKKFRRKGIPHITLKRDYEGMKAMKESTSKWQLPWIGRIPDSKSVEKSRYFPQNDFSLPEIDLQN